MLHADFSRYLESYFSPADFTDSSKNGLQVQNSGRPIRKIAVAVDATSYLIDRAVDAGADALFVHHGLFWGSEAPVTDRLYERVSKLIRHDIALYAMHIPLDAHAEVGNNAGLARAFAEHFEIRDPAYETFCFYKGKEIGTGIRFSEGVPMSRIAEFCRSEGLVPDLYDFGNRAEIRSLGVVTGGAGVSATDAKARGYDLYVTGEGRHADLITAKEIGQSVLYGGHYETETYGVKLFARHLETQFSLETVFLHEKYDRFGA